VLIIFDSLMTHAAICFADKDGAVFGF